MTTATLALRHNLPPQPTPFVGRSEELAQIGALLTDDFCRLLTLVGPGGIGKTRLALEVARQYINDDGVGAKHILPLHTQTLFPDGVYFVSLAALSAVDFIVPAIAGALTFTFERDDPKAQLLDYLRDKALLLVLDNFEHLLDGAQVVNDIWAVAPDVRMLITSRERLNLSSETIFTVGGMDFPDWETPQDALDYSGVKLFIQSARRVKPDFHLDTEDLKYLARICRLVDGMPLGILLAAAWVRTLTLDEIATEIERGLDFLATDLRDVPQRQRSIRAVFDHSWTLLPSEERTTFAKLSVFWGGFTKEAAQHVTGASLRVLAALVDKSLLRRDDDGRYWLHELLRQYAAERLQESPDDLRAARDQHAGCYAQFAYEQSQRLRTQHRKEALAALTADIDNLHGAWWHAVEAHRWSDLKQMVNGFAATMNLRYLEAEGAQLFGQTLTALGEAEHDVARVVIGQIKTEYGSFLSYSGAPEQGQTVMEESLAMLRAYGQPEDRFRALMALAGNQIFINGWMTTPEVWRLAVETAHEGLDIARALGDRWREAAFLISLGNIRLAMNDFEEARRLGRQALKLAEETGEQLMIGEATGPLLGMVAEKLGDFEEARRMRHYSNRMYEAAGKNAALSWNFDGLGYLAFLEKDYDEAYRCYQHSIALNTDLHSQTMRYGFITQTMVNVGKLLAAQGKIVEAVELFSFIIAFPHTYRRSRMWAIDERATLKSQLPANVYDEAVERGNQFDFDDVTQAVLSGAYHPAEPTPLPGPPKSDALTEREIEILQLIAAGRSNREIADQLVFAVGTVKWYVNQIYSKLHVGSRTQAVARAREMNLLR